MDNINEPKIEIKFNSKKLKETGKLSAKSIFCLLVCGLTFSIQFGWNLSVFNMPSSVIRNFINSTYHYEIKKSKLTALWSMTNAAFPFFGIFGAFASGFLCDYFGRKKSMLVSNSLAFVSVILMVIAKPLKSFIPLIVGRAISGLFVGLVSGIAPIYLSEIAPKHYRGIFGVFHQVSVVFGILMANVFGLSSVLGTNTLWPYLIGISCIPAILLYIAGSFLVESPKYININNANPEDIINVLKKLRANNTPRYRIEEIDEYTIEEEHQGTKISFKDFYTKKQLYRPLICTIAIQMSQQLSGISAVLFYSSSVFTNIGLNKETWVSYGTLLISILMFLMTFISIFLVERVGRRPLLLIGTAGTCFFNFLLAISGALSPKVSGFKYVTIISTLGYIIFFSIGPGPITWLITPELFNSNARGKATSIALFFNWLSNFAVTISFPYLQTSIGIYSFIIFGVLLIGFGVFIYYWIPETKGKRIDEITRNFDY